MLMPRRRERSVVESALVACRGPFMAIGVFSGAINILTLSGSLYMLQIYDRVLSSGSVPTLVGLSLLLLAAYALQGALDAIRVRMLSRIGAQFDDAVSAPAFAALQRLPLIGARADLAAQPLRDLDQIRGFLSSLGPTAFFDLPWMPLFFLGCFLLHPWLGVLALAGGILIVGLTIMTEIRSRAAIKAINESVAERQTIIEASRRNAEVLLAMGMEPAFQRRWRIINSRHIKHWLAGSDATSGIGSFAKIFRMVLQSAVLGLGAYLSIRGSITGGAMIAASILTSRALAPIEIAVAHWKGFVAARDGLKRLRSTLEGPLFNVPQRTALPAPKNELTVAGLVVGAPGRQSAIVQGVSFRLQAGHGLGVIGATASGKSTLARALVGAWRPLKGDVRLDGAALDQWPAGALGLHVGYLPQDIELFEGTVAENIARFQPDASDEAIVAAARAANAHDLIVRLENGYETRIGEAGAALSGGQRQRVGLARALFGNPFLVVLDEPNSNLDAEGDEALVRAVAGIRKRGGIVVLITHRLRALTAVDQVAIMAGGQIQQMQSSEEFLKKAMQPQPVPTQPPQRTALS